MIYRRKARLNAARIPVPVRKAVMAVMVCGLALAACEKPARSSAAAAGDAGLKELTLTSARFAPVKLVAADAQSLRAGSCRAGHRRWSA